jgi:hypothetical protein
LCGQKPPIGAAGKSRGTYEGARKCPWRFGLHIDRVRLPLRDNLLNLPFPLRWGEGGSPTALSPAGAGRVRGPFRPFLHDASPSMFIVRSKTADRRCGKVSGDLRGGRESASGIPFPHPVILIPRPREKDPCHFAQRPLAAETFTSSRATADRRCGKVSGDLRGGRGGRSGYSPFLSRGRQ